MRVGWYRSADPLEESSRREEIEVVGTLRRRRRGDKNYNNPEITEAEKALWSGGFPVLSFFLGPQIAPLKNARFLERIGEDRLLYSGEHKLNLVCVGRLRKTMRKLRISATLTETKGLKYILWVNAQLSLILLCKLPENKLGGLLHIWSAGVFTKVIGKRNLGGTQH